MTRKTCPWCNTRWSNLFTHAFACPNRPKPPQKAFPRLIDGDSAQAALDDLGKRIDALRTKGWR